MISVPLSRICRALPFALALFASAFPAALKAAPGSGESDNSNFSAIYVIGDSLSDTGRASAALSLSGAPFPPLPYAPGRLSNGPLWIEYFAPMVRRTYNPAENFAVAGALTGAYDVPGAPPGTQTSNVYSPLLPGMTKEREQLALASTLPLDRKALYVVFGGINDTFLLNIPVVPAAADYVINHGVQNLLSIVVDLRALGAEKIVVVDMPDLGLTPRARNLGSTAAATATQFSRDFNAALNNSLNSLGYAVCRVSAFNLMRDFIEKPKNYGFTNVTDDFTNVWIQRHLDLAEAETYLFWDSLHPTTRAHRYFADEMFHSLARAGMLGNNTK